MLLQFQVAPLLFFLSYLAINIKKNDEIIVPNPTHVSTVHACELLGAKPVFM